MDLTGDYRIGAPREAVWAALNDAEVLKACIPGCDKVEPTGENQYAVGMALKIGPVAAKFAGKILLSDIVAPESYKINFEGQGGVAGFGKGTAEVRLKPDGSGCALDYTVHATVGGKVAQLGQRLIDGTAKSMAEDFFKRFDEAMQQAHPEAYAARDAALASAGTDGAVAVADAGGSAGQGGGIPAWVWIAGGVAVLAVWWFSR